MAGLLDNKFTDVLKGGAAAAVVGANPLLGLLAYPELKKRREQREMDNELARDKMTTHRDMQDARSDLSGLLGRRKSLVPANAPNAPSPDGLNEVVPFQQGPEGPYYKTEQGQQELMGILARLDPAAAAQAALPPVQQERSNTLDLKIQAAIREAGRRGYDPEKTNEFVDTIVTRGGQEGMSIAEMLLMEQRRQKLELDRDAANRNEELREKAFRTGEVGINSSLRRIKSLGDANQQLSTGFLRPGWGVELRAEGLSAWEAMNRFVGNDTSKAQMMLKQYDDFEKGAANLLIDLSTSLSEQGSGFSANTNEKLRQMQEAMANLGKQPGTNAKILSDEIYNLLDIADIEDFEIRDEEVYRQYAQSLSDFGQSGWGLKVGTVQDGRRYVGGPPGE